MQRPIVATWVAGTLGQPASAADLDSPGGGVPACKRSLGHRRASPLEPSHPAAVPQFTDHSRRCARVSAARDLKQHSSRNLLSFAITKDHSYIFGRVRDKTPKRAESSSIRGVICSMTIPILCQGPHQSETTSSTCSPAVNEPWRRRWSHPVFRSSVYPTSLTLPAYSGYLTRRNDARFHSAAQRSYLRNPHGCHILRWGELTSPPGWNPPFHWAVLCVPLRSVQLAVVRRGGGSTEHRVSSTVAVTSPGQWP